MHERTNFFKQLHRQETGQALILVLVLFVVGSCMLVPALAIANNAIKSNKPYEIKTSEVYTADAGIEDGLWRIKYDYFGVDYDEYDFETTYTYQTDDVNDMTANLTIENVWIPTNVTLASLGLDADDARAIIESEQLIVTGSAGAIPGSPYTIKIDYSPTVSENLCVTSVGVWLPQGFTYTTGSGTPESANVYDAYYSVPTVSECPGGTSIVWDYDPPYPLFTEFPGVDIGDVPMSAELQFSYSPPASDPNALPAGIAWITTILDDYSPSDYPISWDTDTRIFNINSIAGDTQIQAYASKFEMRELGDATNGDYVAIGNSLMIGNVTFRDNLLSESSTELDSVPSDGDAFEAYLYWTGWRDEDYIITVMTDSCTNLDTNWSYSTPTDWSVVDDAFSGAYTGGDHGAHLLTMASGLDLSSYVPGSILVSWEQETAYEDVIFDDSCDNFTNWSPGSAWSADGDFTGTNDLGGNGPLLTLAEPLDLSTAGGTTIISWEHSKGGYTDWTDYLYYAFSSNNGTSWSSNNVAFRRYPNNNYFSTEIPSQYLTSEFKMRFEISGFDSSEYCYIDNIKITSYHTFPETAGLDFAVSGNGGATWSENVEACRGETDEEYLYYLPAGYTTSNFKIRFETVGLNAAGQQVTIDNFMIRDLPADNEIMFEIDGTQVYLDSNNNPQTGISALEADETSVILTTSGSQGFAYACHTDVSKLVKAYAEKTTDGHQTGNAVYTVGDVLASTGEYLSHAGWSLVIVYNSPSTAGHYLYLYDYFAFNGGNTNLDFDWDGIDGGDVTDFIIPEPIRNKNGEIIESTAAKITCFIGEGDDIYDNDKLMITGQQSGSSMYLYNSASPWDDVWNGASPDMTYPGIDVDTFEVDWTDGVLLPGDTSLHLDMNSGTDAWNFIYLIISVRSETLTSGTTHYVITRN